MSKAKISPFRAMRARPARKPKSRAIAPRQSGTQVAAPVDMRGYVPVPVPTEGAARIVQAKADLSMGGVLGNAAIVGQFNSGQFRDYSLPALCESMKRLIRDSRGGGTALADELLISQALSLNTVYVEMIRRAGENAGTARMELYMRMGFKAQAQSRLALESLAKIKNPPNVAFVRQANIANGPQQVNNGTVPSGAGDAARAPESHEAPIELLEASNGEWVDARTQGQAGGSNPHLEAVGAVNRATKQRRQGEG